MAVVILIPGSLHLSGGLEKMSVQLSKGRSPQELKEHLDDCLTALEHLELHFARTESRKFFTLSSIYSFNTNHNLPMNWGRLWVLMSDIRKTTNNSFLNIFKWFYF